MREHAPLTGDLEGEPLEFNVLVLAGAGEFVVLVVLVDQVLQDRESLPGFQSTTGRGDNHSEHLPNGEVVVLVIDNGGDATVGVDLQVVWGLVLSLAEIEVDRFVRQPEFFENDGDFPEGRAGFRIPVTSAGGANVPAVGSTGVRVQGELLPVGHSWLVVAVLRGVSRELSSSVLAVYLYTLFAIYILIQNTQDPPRIPLLT